MKIPSRTGVTAGVTTGPPPPERAPGRSRRAVVAGLVATGLVGSSLIMPGLAAAAVPTFPDNVVVFPDRDFVTIEGYQDHVGQTATIEVWRGTQIVGSAQGVVEAGDVAFEINHPGGYCWGAGTSLKVTPDIKPGDRVSIRFGTAANADADDSTTVADAFEVGGEVHAGLCRRGHARVDGEDAVSAHRGGVGHGGLRCPADLS